MENNKFEVMLSQAIKLPKVRIDREMFLREQLRTKYSDDVITDAIKYNPAYAGISVEIIDKIAKNCILQETRNVTGISALTGIPGGLTMVATIPADIIQFYGHVLRILQKLIYLYGWKELSFDSEGVDEESKNMIILFLGVMLGAGGAVTGINTISKLAAERTVKELPKKSLTKGIIYPIVKKIAKFLGVKMTKERFAKGVSKAIPVLGAVVSGIATYKSFKPMAQKLKENLRVQQLADVNYYKNMKSVVNY